MLTDSSPQDLYHLIYYSAAVAPPPGKSILTVLDEITETAQRYNKKNGITGALLYCDGWFLQLLEGPRGFVDSAYFEHIRSDKRHNKPTVIDVSLIDQRDFSQWSMTSLAMAADDPAIIGITRRRARFSPIDLSPEGAISLLHVVSNVRSQQAAASTPMRW
jgi:hypothetical protein